MSEPVAVINEVRLGSLIITLHVASARFARRRNAALSKLKQLVTTARSASATILRQLRG